MADDVFSCDLPDLDGFIRELDLLKEDAARAVRKAMHEGNHVIAEEQRRLADATGVPFISEHIREGGERCFACYRLRMEEAAVYAAQGGYDYFTTTLSISPLKRADKINEIGLFLEEKYGVKHLPSDFKKKGGYQRSIVLSKEYGLYRQDYCGCVYSRAERMERKKGESNGSALGRKIHKGDR